MANPKNPVVVELIPDNGEQPLLLLKGEKGEIGPQGFSGAPGADGAQGPQGPQGPRGLQGPKGDKGDPGPAGADGRDGKDGANGRDGVDGKDGRDGTDGAPGPLPPDAEIEAKVKSITDSLLSKINVPVPFAGANRGGGGYNTEFKPATASVDGGIGLVPAPKAGDQMKVLTGAGTFSSNATGMISSGTYANRPAAATAGADAFYLVTDIGITGCLFRSTGSAWQQVGVCKLFDGTANVALTTTTEGSIFGTGAGSLSLPNGCLAVGTQFHYFAMGTWTGGSGTPQFKMRGFIGSGVAFDTGAYTSVTGVTTNGARIEGAMTIRSLGASGTVAGSGEILMEVNGYWNGVRATGTTAQTVDTTGAISPDVKATLVVVSAVTLTIYNSLMEVTGLV